MAIAQKSGFQQKTEARPPAPRVEGPSTQQIAKRAYEIWQASGRPNGRDQDHWFQAERELRGGQPVQRGQSR